MRAVSAYISAMAVGISDDLRQHVSPDKLQFEVEKELEEQMLSQLVQAIGERKNAITYRQDEVKAKAAQKKMLRFMGYVNEMYTVSREVKGVLGVGSNEVGVEDFEVVDA